MGSQASLRVISIEANSLTSSVNLTTVNTFGSYGFGNAEGVAEASHLVVKPHQCHYYGGRAPGYPEPGFWGNVRFPMIENLNTDGGWTAMPRGEQFDERISHLHNQLWKVIFETQNVILNVDKISKAWPGNDKPSPKVIQRHLERVRKSGSGISFQTSQKRAGAKHGASTPRKKHKRAAKKVEETSEDEDEGEESPAAVAHEE
ncbi:uncharacterized protein BP01DRAFT_378590 [Aspergillus saccharolyticus JOP 1030-1]|uniref:Uncharacterized protein n=1 Tax=Aspergillus saccharolyticus JOP 1030-1 TaxID=1450539 RepID=A0A319A0D7_9EURO|nr:hypothetical protein BP01DRAFT_378590 [Aspergillus saccharolyticus JOP 1030-1]PYH49980.1 hypothetical protein BP01DRAFT_378590 [Aspergillus saccharolyticus JOP 1030-1]